MPKSVSEDEGEGKLFVFIAHMMTCPRVMSRPPMRCLPIRVASSAPQPRGAVAVMLFSKDGFANLPLVAIDNRDDVHDADEVDDKRGEFAGVCVGHGKGFRWFMTRWRTRAGW